MICHHVIQHTPSVERTARALFDLIAPGEEFVFSCYRAPLAGVLQFLKHTFIYKLLRGSLGHAPFPLILAYARAMGAVRLVPWLGCVADMEGLCYRGDVIHQPGAGFVERMVRCWRTTTLNTFDYFGSHAYQHHKRPDEIIALVRELQADPERVLNLGDHVPAGPEPGCALRVLR